MRLFTVGFTTLFQELFLIRWIGAEVPVLSYFKNFLLIASFAGLGIGSLLASRAPTQRTAPLGSVALGMASLIIAIGPALGLDRLVFPETKIDLWERSAILLGTFESAKNVSITLGITILCALSFVDLGRWIGVGLSSGNRLQQYSLEILGSLAGALFYTLCSVWEFPPVVLLTIVATLTWTLRDRGGSANRPRLTLYLIAASVVLLLAQRVRVADELYWSPYNRLDVSPRYAVDSPHLLFYNVNANHDVNQHVLNMTEETKAKYPDFWKRWALTYDLPFRVATKLDRVLIGGAGSGNDVAAALRNGASAVTAVEIDPILIRLGRRLNRTQPYSSPRVQVVNGDIRAFVRQTKETYDIVVFGILDSHTALSSLSSLRLENYVYTVESMRAVARLVEPNGLACVSFYESNREWIGARIYAVIKEATGKKPVSCKHDQRAYFFFGPGANPERISRVFKEVGVPRSNYETLIVRPSTDDWPFLYSHPNGQPWAYLGSLALLVGVCAAMVAWAAKSAGDPFITRFDPAMFLMGAGFLLTETKAIAELSLLFGSTWIVNAATFCGVLIMILVANLLSLRIRRLPLGVSLGAVICSLALAYFIPRESLLLLPPLARVALGVSISCLPLLFAGVAFAHLFARTRSAPNRAYGWNVIGAVVGGALEVLSLRYGIRSLTLVAGMIYAVVMAVAWNTYGNNPLGGDKSK